MKKSELRNIIREELNLLLERKWKIGSISIHTGRNTINAGLRYEFKPQEHNIVYKWLKKLSGKIDDVRLIVDDLDEKTRYTKDVLIVFKSKAFILYGREGVLRIGAGGNDTSAKKLITKEYIDEFLEEIK